MTEQLLLSPPHMGSEEFPLLEAAFASNWIAPTGPMVSAFEHDLAKLTGIDHVAALASGTAALHLALRLSGVRSGDPVWGSTMTFIGGVAPILYEGGVPVFLDVSPDDLLLDLPLLQHHLETAEKAGSLPKVIITTDLYGHVIDPDAMGRLRQRFGFIWISDAAESVGSRRQGEHAGYGADFAAFSFNGNKIVTTSGGGALASPNGELIERARFLSTQARDNAPHYEHSTYGYNYRLSNICAAIGVGQLRVLQDRVDARRRIFETYRRLLRPLAGIGFLDEPADMRANRWLTAIFIDPGKTGFDREEARLALHSHQIESRPLWKPMHLQPVFADMVFHGGNVAEKAFERGLCLPSGSAMAEADVERVVEALVRLAQR